MSARIHLGITLVIDTEGEPILPADAYAMVERKLMTVPLSLTDDNGTLWNVLAVYNDFEGV